MLTDIADIHATPGVPETPEEGGRRENRRTLVLHVAAQLFGERGFEATTMRDIAVGAGMLSGSIYAHFRSKEDLLAAVYEIAIQTGVDQCEERLRGVTDPWERLEIACVVHLEGLLHGGSFTVVSARWPHGAPKVHDQIVAARDRYEAVFRQLVDDLPLEKSDRWALLYCLLGALNWTAKWYKPEKGPPAEIARKFVALFRPKKTGRPAPIIQEKSPNTTRGRLARGR